MTNHEIQVKIVQELLKHTFAPVMPSDLCLPGVDKLVIEANMRKLVENGYAKQVMFEGKDNWLGLATELIVNREYSISRNNKTIMFLSED